MTKKRFILDNLHKIPEDLQKIIASSPVVRTAWKNLTALGRNEWICWIESAKKIETREKRINMMLAEILEGKRRPCCWAGCAHR